jgi:hypothetical protein
LPFPPCIAFQPGKKTIEGKEENAEEDDPEPKKQEEI